MTGPLLDTGDFARLLHAGACFHLARRRGAPPDVMLEPDPSGLRWAEYPFEGGLAAFAGEVALFFGLPGGAQLDGRETILASAEHLHARWLSESGGVVFHTSGSTGTPIPHRHSSAMLRQEAEAVRPFFSDVRRFVCTAPLFHSYGFIFGFLLPKLARKPAVLLPSLPTFLVDRQRAGDLLVSFPLFLGRILEPPPGSVRCLTSTSPCPPGLFSALRGLGYAAVAEIYGSSETGAVAIRSGEDEPFSLLPHWRRRDESSLVRQACGDSPDSVLRLPDRVTWQDERRLVPAGRVDKAVQVAGVNVYPERVAERLLAHPLVKECAVRPMRPEEGSRLKAFVVPNDDADLPLLRKSLRDYMKTVLSTAERPARLSFGSSLPRTDAGKLRDWE